MNVTQLDIPDAIQKSLAKRNIETLLPAQEKAVAAGLLDMGKNLLICTPTASGKTLIAEIAALSAILSGKGTALYICPLKALAKEKFTEFTDLYPDLNIVLSIGDETGAIKNADFVITTSEKLDAEIRHDAAWLKTLHTVIVDEIHLLHDPGRGPTLEVVLTLLRTLAGMRLIGLSATIGNPEELAEWLDATLVQDTWRPVELKKGIHYDGNTSFY